MPETLRSDVVRQLSAIFDTVAAICAEVGCLCLAQRFGYGRATGGLELCDCTACASSQRRVLLHQLIKLAPLAQALDKAGYHDLALSATELALSFEPTMDLELTHAYLHLLLGDNQDAARIYREVLQRRGTIPGDELARLERLAAAHSAEEDIAEISAALRSFGQAQAPPQPHG